VQRTTFLVVKCSKSLQKVQRTALFFYVVRASVRCTSPKTSLASTQSTPRCGFSYSDFVVAKILKQKKAMKNLDLNI
jgi:hypothetical protein